MTPKTIQPPLLAHADALVLLERIAHASATLAYIDAPWSIGDASKKDKATSDLLDLYLSTAVTAKDVLVESGTIVWHTHAHVVSTVRSVLDRVFTSHHFLNEIVLPRTEPHARSNSRYPSHTSLLVYSKTNSFILNPQYRERSPEHAAYALRDEDGRQYRLVDMTSILDRSSLQFSWREYEPPPGRSWRFTRAALEQMYEKGRIVMNEGTLPRQKRYLDEIDPPEVGSVWDDIPLAFGERVRGSYTGAQQSLKLMDRVVQMFSNPGDLIVDPFCGSGTTLIAAEKAGRVWIGGDSSQEAFDISLERLRTTGITHAAMTTSDLTTTFTPSRKVSELMLALKPTLDALSQNTLVLIQNGESKTVEFKETLSYSKHAKKKLEALEYAVVRAIASFLNTEGGVLLIGVTDAQKVIGVQDELKALFKNSLDEYARKLNNLIRDQLGDRFFQFVGHRFLPIDGVQIMRIECQASPEACFLKDKTFYVRRNPETHKLEGPELIDYVNNRFPRGF